MATPTESSILSDLQTAGDSKIIHSLVSDYLRPISALANSKKKKPDEAAIRSLAKQFLSFISKSFPIIYKRIYIQNPTEQQKASLSDFFETYRLCITCLEFVSSQIAGGAHLVQIQRLKLVYCLHSWGRYDDGESEALRVLERLRGEAKSKGEIVPGIDVAGGDSKFGSIVVEAVASVVKNVAMGHSKDSGKYERVLALVEQVRPWCRALDSDVVEKSHNVLVTFLGRCCRFLVEEINHFGLELVRRFCIQCLAEYARSMMKDQVYKFTRRICSSLFSLERTNSSVQIALVTFLLASTSRECKSDLDNNALEFVELVDYCAYKCRAAGTTFCSTLAKHLNDIAGDFREATIPVDLILRLYAIGLDFAEHNVKLKYDNCATSKGAEDDSAVDIMVLERDKLHTLSALLGNCCNIGKNETSIASDPLAELVNAEKKQILAETKASSDSSNLCIIQDAFNQFCDSFFSLLSCTSETKGEGFDDDEVLVPSIIVAGFIVSIRTKLNIPKSMCYITQIIGSSWIQSQGLKYLYISLYNIGVLMYKSKQIEEALKALKLSHRASWTNIQLLCEMYTQKKSFDDHLSEDAIRGLVSDACSRTAFLLEVLHACGNLKVERIIVESLENWSTLENLFRQLSSPMPLIRQWVKIQCKLHKNMDLEDSAPTLCCMLLSSSEVSKRAIGKILEQELLAYQEMTHGYPDFCHRMQMKVIDLLIQDDYAIGDNPLQRARILIRKGRSLRANGIEALKDCIWCLSEAISIMENFYGETRNAGTPACHQLAAAYGLLALCTQEAEPNSEGYTKLHSNIYKLIMRIYKLNNVDLGKCAANLWECRRLSHALFVSPVNESFITNLSEQCGESSKAVDFWIRCLSGSEPGLIGFQQNITCFFNNFIQGLKNDEINSQSAVSANNVNLVVSEITASDPVRSHSLFLAGHLYYDLCEKHISSGRLFGVGCINEMAGNGVEAESFLVWGKSISCSQNLPLFEATFSSILGKLYRKKQLWNFAEQELQSAKRILVDSSSNYSCIRCRLMLEGNLDQQFGDLFHNLSDSDVINDSKERLSHAEVLYKSALEKLNHSQWKNIISDEESKEDLAIRTAIISSEDVAGNAASKPDATGARKGRKTKNVSKPAVKEQQAIPEQISRVTPSRSQSSQNQSISSTGEAQVGRSKQSNGNVVSKVSDTYWEKESPLLGKESYMDESTSEIACICKRTKCWQCLPAETMKSGLLIYFINIKWEYARRKLLARILTGIGKCLGYHDQTHEIHKVVWQSISVLVSRNAFTQTCSPARGSFLLDLIGREIIGDTFATERAAILYSIGWMTVKSFHSKASLGTHLNNQFFPNTSGRYIAQHFLDSGDLHATGSSCPHTEASILLRLAPVSVHDLEQFVMNFYMGLPSTAIICISLLGHAYTSLMQELLLYPSSIHAWMLLSRLNSKNQPIVLLLPLDSVLKDAAPNDENARACQEFFQRMNSGKKWHCPWGSTVVDNVAPAFKVILEENYVTSSGCPLEDTKSARSLWWMIRKKVDHQLGKLLSNLEDSWLGPWRHVLLGDCLECESLNTEHKKLVRNLKSKCKMDINESYLKLVLGAAKCNIEEACLSKQCLQKGCYFGMLEHHPEENCGSNGIDNVSALASRLIHEAVNELHWEDTISREPIILILDLDVQMLPWESIPILRQQVILDVSKGSIQGMRPTW
ncbi:putative Kinetochore protein ndc80 [Hibiscus syriacus]|uniref:Kinetochore protein ndc80 n=1 Tax=Hibiscus syriacus TaxID=106335 RepID=A0A6A3A3C0_HIBSY|nr:putative Kinetochore protein ndc80 [Hibiscus syriacus]